MQAWALSQRLAVIVNKIGRQEQSHAFFCLPKRVGSTCVLAASLSGNTLALGDTIDCG